MAAPDPQRLAGRSCLVLGASGFLGRWLARALVDARAQVTCQVRDRARLPADLVARTEVSVASLTASGSVAALVERVRPEVVFNLAGYGVAKEERQAPGYARLNAELPAELARALGERLALTGGGSPDLVALIHVGSALEYGADASSLDESTTCAPTTDYGRSKLAATFALDRARDAGLACLTARAFTVFGVGERPGRLLPSLLAARGGEGRIPLSSGAQQRDWVYVEDVARVLRGLALVDPERVRRRTAPYDAPAINLACGSLRSVRRQTELFAGAFDIDRDRLGFGDLPSLAEEMFHPPVPVARLREALGWAPPQDPTAAFRRMHEHLTTGAEA